MSAPIAVLVVILVTLAAGLSSQVINSQSNYYAADQNDNAAEIAQNSSDQKPEPQRHAAQTDHGPLKKASKQKNNVCVENCPDIWRPYQLTPWPL